MTIRVAVARRPTFDGWLRLVDQFLSFGVGRTHKDFADFRWYDLYEVGVLPIIAADICMFTYVGGFEL